MTEWQPESFPKSWMKAYLSARAAGSSSRDASFLASAFSSGNETVTVQTEARPTNPDE